jgi:hypothetical protein
MVHYTPMDRGRVNPSVYPCSARANGAKSHPRPANMAIDPQREGRGRRVPIVAYRGILATRRGRTDETQRGLDTPCEDVQPHATLTTASVR